MLPTGLTDYCSGGHGWIQPVPENCNALQGMVAPLFQLNVRLERTFLGHCTECALLSSVGRRKAS